MKTIERRATKAPWNENQWNSGMKKKHNTKIGNESNEGAYLWGAKYELGGLVVSWRQKNKQIGHLRELNWIRF